MNDAHQTEQSAAGESASEESSGQGDASQDQGQQDHASANGQDEVSEGIPTFAPGPPDQAQHTEAGGGGEKGTELQGTPAAPQKGKKALLLGVGSGVLGLIIGLVVGGFAGPALLSGGPGKPDGKASEAVAALASKNPTQLGKVYCDGSNGKPVAQLPPQALQQIQSVKQAGKVQQPLDTEAQVPISITVSNQGRTQTLPLQMVLGVTKSAWCMKGLAQPQPQQ
jgi:hypothetical protein